MTANLRCTHWKALAWLAVTVAACGSAPTPAGPEPVAGRAIFVSFDALNEDRARTTVDPQAIPSLLAYFDEASCADGARPMFPSYTAASHAALWTGVYGNVNGIAGNSMVPLPWADFSLTETRSGYDSRQLGAESIWLAAARAGRRTVAHHVTQAPGVPGYWHAEGGRDQERVARDSAALADPGLTVLNGYGVTLEAGVLTARGTPPQDAPPWTGLAALGPLGVPLREVSWTIGGDSVHALFFGRDLYREVVVSPTRDAATGVRVRPAAVEREAPARRELARHFAGPLWLPRPGGRAAVYFRLWQLELDLSAFQLFHSRSHVLAANPAAPVAAYEEATGGFIGNSEPGLLRRGDFGYRLDEEGDGTAELKYLETVELATRQFMRGSAWLWQERAPALQVEYYPILDDLDHLWLGVVSPGARGYDSAAGPRINALRSRGWAIADRRLAGLLELAREGDALLVLSGDHGMRPTWRWFQVNVALREAGLLVLDGSGRPDLSRTRAYAPNGYYVHVNRVERKGGIVPGGDIGRIADSAARVLRAARSPEGTPIVTRTWRPEPDDTLGIGGPAGGDLYFDLAPGYSYSNRLGDDVTADMHEAGGSHGFPSTDRDMLTVVCALGPGVGGQRLPTARVIDAAPTVAEWLGIPAPADARGQSFLRGARRPPESPASPPLD